MDYTLCLPNGVHVVYIAVYGNSSFLFKIKKNYLEQCACEVVLVFNYMHTLGFVTGIYIMFAKLLTNCKCSNYHEICRVQLYICFFFSELFEVPRNVITEYRFLNHYVTF